MFTTRPEIIGTFGVCASTHWLGTATGMAVLEKGGNAFDSACAMGFVLQVVEPHLNGPGGDMPALIYSAQEQRLRVVCGQGTAPAAASIGAFRDMGLGIIPGTGLLASCVPGAFDAWLLMLRDYGTISLREALAPAIDFAGRGYPLVSHICATIDSVKDLFREHWSTSAETYLPGGKVPKAGTLFRNPALAGFYRRLVAEAESAVSDRSEQVELARQAFRQGFVADAIDRFCRTTSWMDTSGEAHGGLLTGDDMADWSATYEEPLTHDYGRYTVAKPGPWAQSPVFLQQLALLSGFDLSAMDPTGPDFVHTVTECAKLAYADREAFYGDPDFTPVPMETLLSTAYNDERRKLIGERASLELRPGTPGGMAARLASVEAPAGADAAGAGEPTMSKTGVEGDTCHIDVIDRFGNMVSATPSGGWLQSNPVIPELGFALGTRMQMFWLDEGLPNSLAPRKRPRTTLSPSFAFRDGEPYMPFGTPGGDGQDQWSLIFFLRHVHHELNLQEAIDMPTFQTMHFPSSFYPRQARPGEMVVEGRLPQTTIQALEARGHSITAGGDWSQGRLSACARDGEMLKAAANARLMQGYAIGR